MYANAEDVLEVTGYSVDHRVILQAQAIVEVVSGRPETAVHAVDDLYWLRYATAWQAAYMDTADVLAQANVKTVKQDRSTVDFGDRVFALSPLVVEAVKRLSWNKSRPVRTRPFRYEAERLPWWHLW